MTRIEKWEEEDKGERKGVKIFKGSIKGAER